MYKSIYPGGCAPAVQISAQASDERNALWKLKKPQYVEKVSVASYAHVKEPH